MFSKCYKFPCLKSNLQTAKYYVNIHFFSFLSAGVLFEDLGWTSEAFSLLPDADSCFDFSVAFDSFVLLAAPLLCDWFEEYVLLLDCCDWPVLLSPLLLPADDWLVLLSEALPCELCCDWLELFLLWEACCDWLPLPCDWLDLEWEDFDWPVLCPELCRTLCPVVDRLEWCTKCVSSSTDWNIRYIIYHTYKLIFLFPITEGIYIYNTSGKPTAVLITEAHFYFIHCLPWPQYNRFF